MKNTPFFIWSWFVGLVVLGVFTRWIPHPPNFAALLSVAIFSGFILPAPLALVAPVLSAVLGDAWLGYHDGMWVVYLSLLPLVYLGQRLPELNKRASTWVGWLGAGLIGSVFFFVTTNLAVWWFSSMYPHTGAGLGECFALALPFFHNSLASTEMYLGGLALVNYSLVKIVAPRLA